MADMVASVEEEKKRAKSEEELEREMEKRVEEEKARRREKELLLLREAKEEPPVPEALAEQGYIEQVERKPERDLPKPPADDQGKPLVVATDDEEVEPIILPMTKEEFETGIKEDLWTNLRWLAEWSLYVIKKYGGRVFFKG